MGEVVDLARALVDGGVPDAEQDVLTPLSGGMSNQVFALAEDPDRIVKVFCTPGDAPEREWDALMALSGSGIAPEPVHFAAGDPAVVVMTRLSGSPLPANALGVDHARAIGRVHRLVHQVTPASRRSMSHAGLRALRAALMNGESEPVPPAWRAARRWIATADVERLVAADRSCFSRGDPNLTNYLWRDGGPVLVDWEDSGYNSPALELADMAEHASTRDLDDHFWDQVADATELTPTEREAVHHGRRLMACFWLVLIESRQRQGLPTTITLDEQASRTLTILET